MKKPLTSIFRTVFSVNQLSIYGAVADLCNELAPDSRKQAEGEVWKSMVVPDRITPNANAISQTDLSAQVNLLREYEQKFAELPDDQKLSKLCSDAGFLKEIGKGQFFITLDQEVFDEMKTLCREYTLPRSEEASRVRGWILGNTKIGPVLDAKVCLHQERYGIEILIESLFRDRTVSWVRIVNGINKYVTETSETISLEDDEHRVTVKLVAKAKPQPKPAVTLSPISVPLRERKWIDINLERLHEDCFAVSKAMIRLLQHNPSIPREDDGAVRFDDLMEASKAKFDGTSQWPANAWITFLAKRGGPKKRCQYCLNPNSSKHFVYFRAIQGHSGGNLVDPALQDNVLLPEDFTENNLPHRKCK